MRARVRMDDSETQSDPKYDKGATRATCSRQPLLLLFDISAVMPTVILHDSIPQEGWVETVGSIRVGVEGSLGRVVCVLTTVVLQSPTHLTKVAPIIV